MLVIENGLNVAAVNTRFI